MPVSSEDRMHDESIISRNELNLILLIDNSYSMDGARITQVNSTMPVLNSKLIELADKYKVELMMRVIAFSDEAVWVVGSVDKGENVNSVVWPNLDVVGGTSTPKAIYEANKCLRASYLIPDSSKDDREGNRVLPPVVILITDGYCNPGEHSAYLDAIDEMKKRLAGNTGKEKVIRIAVGVVDYNRDELVEFATSGIYKDVKQPFVFEVDSAEKLGEVIQWVVPTSIIASISSINPDNAGVPDMGDPDFVNDFVD